MGTEGIMDGKRRIVMLGTSADANGGIASVIDVYRQHGLFERRYIRCIATHCSGSRREKIGIFIRAWLTYVGMLLSGRVALAHVHSAAGTSFWRKASFLVPSFVFRVPTILHLHSGRFPHYYEKTCNARMQQIFRFIAQRASCIVTVSGALRTWAGRVIQHPEAVTVCNPMLMPPESDTEGRAGNRILFLGKLGPAKGTADLLQALQQIVGRHPDVKLILGGDGDIDGTRADIDRLGLTQQVELPGWVSGAGKQALLQQSDILVLPSYTEGMPMSVLEAMAAGLPVVATRVGGISEAVSDGREGLLIEPGDVAALAEALDWLLLHEETRVRMGLAGRRKVAAMFSCDVAIPALEAIYDRLIRKRA